MIYISWPLVCSMCVYQRDCVESFSLVYWENLWVSSRSLPTDLIKWACKSLPVSLRAAVCKLSAVDPLLSPCWPSSGLPLSSRFQDLKTPSRIQKTTGQFEKRRGCLNRWGLCCWCLRVKVHGLCFWSVRCLVSLIRCLIWTSLPVFCSPQPLFNPRDWQKPPLGHKDALCVSDLHDYSRLSFPQHWMHVSTGAQEAQNTINAI